MRLERVCHDGLGHGLKSAPAGSLENAEQQQHRQGGRRAAQEAGNGENHNAEEEEVLAPHHARRPGAQGQNDGVRNQVAGQHPGSLVRTCAQAARDVRQGHIGNGGVEHFHKRRQRHGRSDQPGIDARLPHRLQVGEGGYWRRSAATRNRSCRGACRKGCLQLRQSISPGSGCWLLRGRSHATDPKTAATAEAQASDSNQKTTFLTLDSFCGCKVHGLCGERVSGGGMV